ncbi:hypothetical protein [Sulfurospirillum oryzae]|nr:hypothetical protein [Sulfurospirillum oryzae]
MKIRRIPDETVKLEWEIDSQTIEALQRPRIDHRNRILSGC